MDSERTPGAERREPGPSPAAAESSAEARAALTAREPLSILSEERGSDPYNHTGRFSVPETEA